MSTSAPAPASTTVASALAFGTFGELLQGVLPDGADFLVTLPIARWAIARFRLEPGRPVRVHPARKQKSLRLARMLLATVGGGAGGTLLLDGDLPEGKGLASSSADLVATARAVGRALGLDSSAAAIESWLCRIEPTDGVMYPGIVAFDHRRVRLRAFLGRLPPLTIVGLDEGGQVDTVAFNRIPKPFSAAGKREYARLLDALTDAIRSWDLPAVGEIATRSSILHQQMRPRPALAEMLRIARRVGALGVVCAHSGTMLGLLLADNDPDHQHRLTAARRACAVLPGTVTVFHSLPFGAQGLHFNDLAGRHAV